MVMVINGNRNTHILLLPPTTTTTNNNNNHNHHDDEEEDEENVYSSARERVAKRCWEYRNSDVSMSGNKSNSRQEGPWNQRKFWKRRWLQHSTMSASFVVARVCIF